MRPAVLSIATERVVSPIRNAVLAHAGYAVIPATSTEEALNVLRERHVCALVVGSQISRGDLRILCREARRLRVPAIVLDPYDFGGAADPLELHVNPLDGPETLLNAVAQILARDHRACVGFTQ